MECTKCAGTGIYSSIHGECWSCEGSGVYGRKGTPEERAALRRELRSRNAAEAEARKADMAAWKVRQDKERELGCLRADKVSMLNTASLLEGDVKQVVLDLVSGVEAKIAALEAELG